jgi:hypothetical protein
MTSSTVWLQTESLNVGIQGHSTLETSRRILQTCFPLKGFRTVKAVDISPPGGVGLAFAKCLSREAAKMGCRGLVGWNSLSCPHAEWLIAVLLQNALIILPSTRPSAELCLVGISSWNSLSLMLVLYVTGCVTCRRVICNSLKKNCKACLLC